MAPGPLPAVAFWEHDGELFEYPPELCIRNTFVCSRLPRSPSLEDFFQERRVRSCPSSELKNAGCEDEDRLEVDESTSFCIDLGRRESASTVNSGSTDAASTSAGSSDTPSGEEKTEEVSAMNGFSIDADLEDAAPEAVQESTPTVLSLGSLLADCLPSASPDYDANYAYMQGHTSGEAPNTGSNFHLTGQCKPCAFFYTRGCESGADCVFCHICGPGEKKYRRKEKQEARKFRKRATAAMGGLLPPLGGIFYF